MAAMRFCFAGVLSLGSVGLDPLPVYGQAEYFPPSNLPNVILITADHLRWDQVAANSNPAIITPNLDQLIEAWTTFRGSGIPSGQVSDELVEIIDVMPSLLEILGMEQTKGNPGDVARLGDEWSAWA